MALELVDICVNLANKSFRQEEAQIVARAAQAGVTRMLVTGSNEKDSAECIALAHRYAPHLWATVGVHPHHAKEWSDAAQSRLAALAADTKVRAIGEAGLDFNRNFSTPQDQKKAFEAQLELALDLKLPVFLHEREAHEAFIKILSRYRDRLSDVVVHCFTGEDAALSAYLEMDCHIGITGWICDERRGLHLRELISNIPLDRLMIETDAPYLLPRDLKPPPKSRRNEPAFLVHILNTMAQILQLSPTELAQATTDTAKRFYRLD